MNISKNISKTWKWVSLSIILLSFCPLSIFGSEKPNVLLIAIDDLNDWIGCLGGHPDALTPNME